MGLDLLRLVREPSDVTGLYVATDNDWEFTSYADVAAQALGICGHLRAEGVVAGDVVTVAVPPGALFMPTLFGVIAAGATASPVPSPPVGGRVDAHVEHVRHVLRSSGSTVVVVPPDAVERYMAFDLDVQVVPAECSDTVTTPVEAARVSILQFTSGSTGRPRGVAISRANVEADLDAVCERLRITSADHGSTWLPPHHDMGLIGCVLLPAMLQSSVWVMSPEQFVRSPVRFLRTFMSGSRISAMPPFGLSLIARSLARFTVDDLDLSAWRFVITGAERIGAATLGAFLDAVEPYGFRPSALVPAYGLAETTVAATLIDLEEAPVATSVRREGLRWGERIDCEVDVPVVRGCSNEELVVSCGRAISSVAVEIVDDDGRPLPAGHLGEITVDGPAVFEGYCADSVFTNRNGPHRTGDAGFVLDDRLYVLGRMGDAITVRGRNIFIEDLEARVLDGERARAHIALIAGNVGGDPQVVVLADAAVDFDGLVRKAVLETGGAVDVRWLRLRRGGLERTTSGKIRRRVLWRRLLDGELSEP